MTTEQDFSAPEPELWLNFAQLFYFSNLLFVYSRNPQRFIMLYGLLVVSCCRHQQGYAATAGRTTVADCA